MFGDTRRTDRAKAEFEALATPHLDALFGGAMRLTRNERDAEDLVQDAFLRAFRFFDQFEKGTNIKAWLFKILTNTFINKYRRTVKERSVVEGSERETVQELSMSRDGASEEAGNPEQWFADRMLSEDVMKAVDSLPIDFRMVVLLADLQDFSYRECAEILDVPIGTVMSRLFRGRKILQRELRAHAIAQGILPADPAEVTEATVSDLADYRERRVQRG